MPKRAFVASILLFAVNTLTADEHICQWRQDVTLPWIGPQYWANPMMDWRLRDRRIECHTSGDNHDVHLMTKLLDPGDDTLVMVARLGLDPKASGRASSVLNLQSLDTIRRTIVRISSRARVFTPVLLPRAT